MNDKSVNGVLSNLPTIEQVRTESSKPNSFRLKRKLSGEYVLQGQFAWMEGNSGGTEWRDLETIFGD
jgi:hypothetical protein